MAYWMTALLLALALSKSSLGTDPKAAHIVRDGSSRQKAIIVTQPIDSYVRWEYQYLATHFPGYVLEHAFAYESRVPDESYDYFVITWHGRKAEVWFDIRKPFQKFSRASGQR